MGTIYNCLCPACGNIRLEFLEDEAQADGLICRECGAKGLRALPKSIFGT